MQESAMIGKQVTGPVESLQTTLRERMVFLTEKIECLGSHLTPILRPSNPTPTPTDTKAREQPSPLEEFLCDQIRDVQRCIVIVSDIAARSSL